MIFNHQNLSNFLFISNWINQSGLNISTPKFCIWKEESKTAKSVSPVLKWNHRNQSPARRLVKKYRHVRPHRMYPWSFFRSSCWPRFTDIRCRASSPVHTVKVRQFSSMASGLSRDLPTVIDTPRREGHRFCPYEYYSDATPSPLSRKFVISDERAH